MNQARGSKEERALFSASAKKDEEREARVRDNGDNLDAAGTASERQRRGEKKRASPHKRNKDVRRARACKYTHGNGALRKGKKKGRRGIKESARALVNQRGEKREKTSTMNFDPLQQFAEVMADFLSTMCETFPDDDALQLRMRLFNDVARNSRTMQERLCRAYHEQMSPYYESCSRKDPTPFIEGRVEILVEMGFREKYADLTDATLYEDPKVMEENIANVWEFIEKLNYYATLHMTVPATIMERVVDVANDIVERGDHADRLNPVEMVRLSKGILSGMSSNDCDQLLSNLPLLMRTATSTSVGNQAASAGVDIQGIMGVLQMALAGQTPRAGDAAGDGAPPSLLATLAALAENTTNNGQPPSAAAPAATATTPRAPPSGAPATLARRRGAWRPPTAPGP